MPQCWLSNWTAHAMAFSRLNPDVLVRAQESLSQTGGVTCFATKLDLDLISGMGVKVAMVHGGNAVGADDDRRVNVKERILYLYGQGKAVGENSFRRTRK